MPEFASYLPGVVPGVGELPAFDLLRKHNPLAWRDVQLLTPSFPTQPELFSGTALDAHLISVVLRGAPVISGSLDGKNAKAHLRPGSSMLVPQRVTAQASWTTSYHLGELMLSPQLLSNSVRALGDRGRERLELVPHFSLDDPFIYQVCRLLVQEANLQGPLGPLYADALAHALAVHVLRHYSTFRLLQAPPGRGLTREQLRRIEDYVKARLAERLSLSELASVAKLSPNYFAAQFKRTVGLSPHQFVIHCRVERAKELLTRGQLSVAEVANVVGFFDQSHLNRHVKRLLGVTPKALVAERDDRKNVPFSLPNVQDS